MIRFKYEDWIGRTFKCLTTGEKVKLTKKMVRPRAFIPIGTGYIDLGDGYYYRTGGNIQEVTKPEKCENCKKEKVNHKVDTLNCPIRKTKDKTGSYAPFHDDKFWKAKEKKTNA